MVIGNKEFSFDESALITTKMVQYDYYDNFKYAILHLAASKQHMLPDIILMDYNPVFYKKFTEYCSKLKVYLNQFRFILIKEGTYELVNFDKEGHELSHEFTDSPSAFMS